MGRPAITALFLGAVVAAAPSAWAQAAPAPAASWSQSVSPTYVSQYMFRGDRLGGPSLQGAYDASVGNWDLGIWASTPLADRVPGQSDPEFDPYGSYTWNLSDRFSVQPGFTLYTYVEAPTNQGFYHATFEPDIAVNATFGGLKLTPKFYYDVIAEGPTYELNASYAVLLKNLGTELDFAGTAGTFVQDNVVDHAVPKTEAWGNYWQLGVAVPYQIAAQLKATVGWAYTRGSDAYVQQAGLPKTPDAASVGRGVFSAGLVWTF